MEAESELRRYLERHETGVLNRLSEYKWLRSNALVPSFMLWKALGALRRKGFYLYQRYVRFPYFRFKRMEAESELRRYLERHEHRLLNRLSEYRWLRSSVIVPSLILWKILCAPLKRRRVLFLHQSYYHFYYLSRALRARGWDAILVSLEPSNSSNASFYHDEDLNLYSDDYEEFRRNIREFFTHATKRFTLLHFAGAGHMSFFPENWGWTTDDPWDILEWKRLGHKVAYTVSGCNDGVAQSSVTQWSSMGEGEIVCDTCIWQTQPDVCNDAKNLQWGRKVEKNCDLFFTEGGPALDYQAGTNTVREPTTMCLDPWFWRPDLAVPAEFALVRKTGEMLVYHAVGNYELRSQNGRNIKGTPAVFEAIERLKAEGIPVRLVFVTGMKSTEVRFVQVQCDVIVDQLNYGRYGATAREGMMLGKPTICYINPNEPSPDLVLSYMRELPLISATEKSIYQVLKELLLMDPEKRVLIGRASRDYALKWHSAEACAKRYEQIYDQLVRNESIRYPQTW